MAAVLVEQHDEWQVTRRYLGNELIIASLAVGEPDPDKETPSELEPAAWPAVSENHADSLLHHLTGRGRRGLTLYAIQHRHGRLGSRVDTLHPICYLSTMAMNIKDPQTEALAAEVAALANETKTQAVRTALQERKERLQARQRRYARAQRIDRFLEDEAWPQIPEAVLGRPVPKAERETILGYGPEGA
jgi:antitoxin VapB